MVRDAGFFIKHLQLHPHPEGGYYKESYRSANEFPADVLTGFNGNRSYSTAIYYLLQQGDFSAFHKIKSDECWHYYSGDVLLIHVLYNNGNYKCIKLGSALNDDEVLQFVVPANTWFAAECSEKSSFVLTGCTVSPGFDFADFELADKHTLSAEFTNHIELITRLTR